MPAWTQMTSPIDSPVAGPADPIVNTVHMCEPKAKAAVPTVASQTPEYRSIVNTLRRATEGQIIAIARKLNIVKAGATWEPQIDAIAEAECLNLAGPTGFKKLEL
jgi:hypothetical protein